MILTKSVTTILPPKMIHSGESLFFDKNTPYLIKIPLGSCISIVLFDSSKKEGWASHSFNKKDIDSFFEETYPFYSFNPNVGAYLYGATEAHWLRQIPFLSNKDHALQALETKNIPLKKNITGTSMTLIIRPPDKFRCVLYDKTR
ncbi:MAG: hypothetical protein JW812_02285 [Alphaproteobacteria bacterium]|nr:hypothetical protein [Alphaproteobacteria bacterium]MBN2780073.1 hypothetical protein [Alphaproteobacteria bacterium]